MTEEERKAAEDKARKDAETKADADVGVKLDKLLSHVDSMTKRMDAMEAERADRAKKDSDEKEAKEREDKARRDAACPRMDGEGDDEWEKRKADEESAKGDPERVAADKKRKDEEEAKAKSDAEEKEREEKEKADKAKADSDTAKRIADVEKVVYAARDRSASDKASFADAQAKADRVYQAFGDSAPPAMQGEDLDAYRRRLAGDLKKHTKLKDANLHGVTDPVAFADMEERIYADAEAAANSPALVQPGRLRERKRVDGGHTIITYDGHPSAWMDQFSGPQRQAVTEFKL